MKKFATLLLNSLTLLSSTLLMAQSYSSSQGYTSNPSHSTPTYSSNSYDSNQIRWLRSYSDAVALAQSTSKPIAILFTGTGWCPACLKLEREVLNRPEFARMVQQKFVFLKAEFPDYSESAVMASPYKPLLDRYNINAFPTFVVTNSNGQQLFTVNYQAGGPQAYAQEFLQKLTSIYSSHQHPMSAHPQ